MERHALRDNQFPRIEYLTARETQELSSRVLLLTKLLDRVGGQLDPEEAHMLLYAAER
jgi:hypothetical protein